MYKSVPISSITTKRHERQRKELAGLEELADSIRRTGLINPVCVDTNLILIAGERRLTACRDILGWTAIPVYISAVDSNESEVDARLIELEENVARVDLHWKDKCFAVADFHQLNCTRNPGWTMEKSGQLLSLSQNVVSRYCAVARAIEAGDPLVCAADKYSVALNIVERKAERAAANETNMMADMLSHGTSVQKTALSPEGSLETTNIPAEEYFIPSAVAPFIHTDFNDYLLTSTEQFNFIHCDFPYGINAGSHKSGAADKFGGYADSEDVYWQLINTLLRAMQFHVAPSAHLMFWYSMNFHTRTIEALERMGWKVNPFPLIWYKSDNSGILPDPKRGPRRNYETALLCSRGDRPVVQPVSNVFAGPNTKSIHMSEKPEPMLRHFFRMFVDSSTRMLDPTMGSGNAVVVAEDMGAKSVLGLERDLDFYNNAVEKYLAARE